MRNHGLERGVPRQQGVDDIQSRVGKPFRIFETGSVRRPITSLADDSQLVPRLAPKILGVFNRPPMQFSEIREPVTRDRSFHEHERILSSLQNKQRVPGVLKKAPRTLRYHAVLIPSRLLPQRSSCTTRPQASGLGRDRFLAPSRAVPLPWRYRV